jgi:flagellar motor switch protein FliN/FliY
MGSDVDGKSTLRPIDVGLLKGVRIRLNALLGRGEMSAEELMKLEKGSVVTLASSLADPVELYLDDALVARGELVAVGDNFAVRITDISTTS